MGKRFEPKKFETLVYCKKCYKELTKCECLKKEWHKVLPMEKEETYEQKMKRLTKIWGKHEDNLGGLIIIPPKFLPKNPIPKTRRKKKRFGK